MNQVVLNRQHIITVRTELIEALSKYLAQKGVKCVNTSVNVFSSAYTDFCSEAIDYSEEALLRFTCLAEGFVEGLTEER